MIRHFYYFFQKGHKKVGCTQRQMLYFNHYTESLYTLLSSLFVEKYQICSNGLARGLSVYLEYLQVLCGPNFL